MRRALFLFLTLYASAAIAAQVNVRLERLPDVRQCAGAIVAHSVCTGDRCPAAVRVSFADIHPLVLDEQFDWTIETDSDGCWSAPVTIRRAAFADAVSLQLWKSAAAAGDVVMTDASPPPAELRLTLTTRAPKIEAVVTCPVRQRKWSCRVPAALLDLRFEADGFVPFYAWDQHFDRERPERMAVRLTRGASVAGWVGLPSGSVEGATVELLQAGAVTEGGTVSSTPGRTASVNGRGFFQFAAVTPGRYVVVAGKRGWSRARSTDVSVAPGQEVVLRDRLDLEPLASLEVAIDPPAAPDGRPWNVKLSRRIPLSSTFGVVRTSAATPAGSWFAVDLEADHYQLTIADDSGSTYATRSLQIAGKAQEWIQIDRIAVRGHVLGGEDPMPGAVTFSDGSVRLSVETDDEGAFQRTLPHDGRWEVAVRPRGTRTSIPAEAVDVKRAESGAPAEIEIALAGGTLEGTVVNEAGTPLSATVRIREGSAIVASGGTDTDGTFRFRGLQTGTFAVEADAGEHGSTLVRHAITDGESTPLRIVVEARKRVHLRLVAPNGAPVSGALVWQFLPPFRRRVETVSGPDGVATVVAPPDGGIEAAIFARGFPIKLLGLPSKSADDVRVVMPALGAPLTLRPRNGAWPFIAREGEPFFPVAGLFFRTDPMSAPYGLTPEGFVPDLEPGVYLVCPGPAISESCERRVVQPGAHATVQGSS